MREHFRLEENPDLEGDKRRISGRLLQKEWIMRTINNPGGFVWTGSLAKWDATIPIDFSGLHSGFFTKKSVGV